MPAKRGETQWCHTTFRIRRSRLRSQDLARSRYVYRRLSAPVPVSLAWLGLDNENVVEQCMHAARQWEGQGAGAET